MKGNAKRVKISPNLSRDDEPIGVEITITVSLQQLMYDRAKGRDMTWNEVIDNIEKLGVISSKMVKKYLLEFASYEWKE